MSIARFPVYTNPITGRLVEQTKCGLCGATLPLPCIYPTMVLERKPKEKLYDLTDSIKGEPRVIFGFTIVRPVCWHHAH